MSEMTRRGFLSSMGAAAVSMGLASGAVSAVAEEAAPASDNGFVPGGGSFAEGMLDLGWTGTPVEIERLGGCTMPLEELNRRRKAYVDSKTEDHVCEDGEVIPVVFVKAAAKLNSIGSGTLSPNDNGVFTDTSLRAVMLDLNEEQAQFYVDMPADMNFNVVDASVASGKPVEECYGLLEHLQSRGWLAQHERNDGMVYHIFPLFQGLAEMHNLNHALRAGANTMIGMPGYGTVTWLEQGTPVFHSVPCDLSVVAEDSCVLPYDDVREIVKTKKTLSLGPCVCRYNKAKREGSPTLPAWEDFVNQVEGCYDYYDETIGQYIENCIYMDDEAENGIAMGWSHPATPEEVLASLDRSVAEGYVVHAAGGTRCETLCLCNVDGGCGMCRLYDALGEGVKDFPAYEQKSRYDLVVDFDACLGCGACVQRCPMHAVTLGEDGKPQVGATCLRCGQCGMTCPVEARKLVARPEGTWLELPNSFVEDNMMKAAYRFEHGLIQ